MTENEVPTKLDACEESINMLNTQLIWILTECNKDHVRPNTNVGNEMVQRFFSLYRDYQRILSQTTGLILQIEQMEFDDLLMRTIYELHGFALLNRLCSQDFQNFLSIAETGKLPMESDNP